MVKVRAVNKDCIKFLILLLIGTNLGYPHCKVVQIYFDTATFDKIDRDMKVLLNA